MAKRSVLARTLLAVKAFAGTWREQSLSDLDDAMDRVIGGQPTLAGVNVSENTALNFLALYACISVRAKAIGTLSLHLYKRKDRGAERLTGERLYHLVHDSPNEEMTSVSWRKAGSAHIDTWGDGCSFIDRATIGRNAGQIRQIYPLKPDRIKAYRDSNNRLKYEYTIRKADGTQEKRIYDRDQVLDIPGLGYDGVRGYSPVSMQRQAVGLGMAQEQLYSRFLGHGTHPSGLLVPKAVMRDPEYQTWKAGVQEQYSGLSKAGTLMVLSGDASYTPMTMPLKDAEFLGQRRFQLEEMARLYSVPLILLQDQEKTSSWGTGIEHIMIGFVTFTIMPEAREWEQRMNMRLLTEEERAAGWYFEHDLNSLMRGDYKSRMEGFAIGRQTGMYSPNDLLVKENENPRTDPGGDAYWDSGPQGQGGNQSSNSNARAALRPVMTDAAARILKRERQDIGAQAERFASKDDMEGFCGWLGDFWPRHEAFCADTVRPAFEALGDPGMAVKAAKTHVSRLQSLLKAAQTGGIDEVKSVLEAREPASCGLFGEE